MPKVLPQYKEAAKRRIVEAALRIFAEKGYHEATMEDVADKLGVSEGAIYLYFKSKRELFKAIGQAGQHQRRQIISSSIRSEDPVKSFFDSAIDLYEQYEPVSGLVLELFAEASRDASLKKIIRDDFDSDRDTIGNFLMELRKHAKIGAQADVRSISIGLLALIHGYAISRVLGVGKDEAKRTHTEAARAMLNGTLTKSANSLREPSV